MFNADWSMNRRYARRVGRKQKPRQSGAGCKDGAVEWIRTTDLLITNQLLYQLSYNSIRMRNGELYRPLLA